MSGWNKPAPIMEKDGPGKWDIMHLKTFAINSHQDKLDFIELFYFIINTLKCANCVGHANMYVTAHPIEAHIDNLAEYMVDFHNAVNERLGKPVIPFEEARNMYIPRLREVMMRNPDIITAGKARGANPVPKETVVRNTTRPVRKESNHSSDDKPCETCGKEPKGSLSNNHKFTVNYTINGKPAKVSATDFTPMYQSQ